MMRSHEIRLIPQRLNSTSEQSERPEQRRIPSLKLLTCWQITLPYLVAGYRIAESLFIENLLEDEQVKKWQCMVCGFVYDEEQGLPEEGIAPGTPWQDIPDDWMCPDCGVGKEDFEMVEI